MPPCYQHPLPCRLPKYPGQRQTDYLQEEQGKVFVLDSSGNVSLVLLSIEEYTRLASGAPKTPKIDPEQVNQEILKAQLEDDTPVTAPRIVVPKVSVRAPKQVDLREEVIDPSFDFDTADDI